MSLTVVKIGPDRHTTFLDEDGQEIRIGNVRHRSGTWTVGITLCADGSGVYDTYFQLHQESWYKVAGTLSIPLSREGSDLDSWLNGIHTAWLNAIMMEP